MKEIGAPGWTLTCDLSLRRGLLYTLSYRGFALDCWACEAGGASISS